MRVSTATSGRAAALEAPGFAVSGPDVAAVAVGEGVVGAAAGSRRSVSRGTGVAVPLIAHERVVGVLSAARGAAGEPFSGEELHSAASRSCAHAAPASRSTTPARAMRACSS